MFSRRYAFFPTQRWLLLVLGLALALRALAWPLEMSAHHPAAPATAFVAAAEDAACHAQHDQHLDPDQRAAILPAWAQAAQAHQGDGVVPGSADDAGVCLILCAIACAPLLFVTPDVSASIAIQPLYAAPQPLPLGAAQPPALPPPIA